MRKIDELECRLRQIESEKERRIEPLLNELNDYPELKEMFNSFLTSFEHKIRAMKGEEKEVIMTADNAMKEKGDKWIKVRGEEAMKR